MRGADDEGLTGVHRLGGAENSSMAQAVGDGGCINGRLSNVVFAAATAVTAKLGVWQLFDRHSVAFL